MTITIQWKRYVNILFISGLVTYLNFVLYLQNKTPNSNINLQCASKCENEETLSAYIQQTLGIIKKLKDFSSPSNLEQLSKYEINLQILLKSVEVVSKPTVKNNSRTLKYSCPEKYKGSTFGYPYFTTGFVREKCNKPQLNKTITLVLDRPDMTENNFLKIADYAKNSFFQIFVLVDRNFQTLADRIKLKMGLQAIQFLQITDLITVGANLQKAISLTTSKFVLIAPHLGKLDNSSDLERMINVLEISTSDIIGAAVKNIETGEWDRGCYQSEMKLHHLKYRYGYYRSEHECLYCDYVVSPFLSKTSFLKNLNIPLLNYGIYKELFLQLKHNKKTSLVCPDVLFYQRNNNLGNSFHFKSFAENRMIRKMIDERGNTFLFDGKVSLATSLAVPYNGRQNLANAIKDILKECSNISIQCELQEGTLMGAVKFNHVLLWERDADITVLSSNFQKFREILIPRLITKGYIARVVSNERCCFENVTTGGIATVVNGAWSIEIYGQHKLTTKQGLRTKVKFANDFVYVPENPGLYIRNRYGHEIYKHAEHWMSTGKKSGWDVYKSGAFLPCHKPGHHACLDQFHGDGDIQFQEFL